MLCEHVLLVALLVLCLAAGEAEGVAPVYPKEDFFTPYVQGMPVVTTVLAEETAEGVKVTRLRFASVEGTAEGTTRPSEVYAVIARPAAPAPERRMGILLCHGGSGCAEEGWAVRWAQRDFVALAMDLPGIGFGKTLKSVGRMSEGQPGGNRWTVSPTPYACVLFDAVVAGLKAFNLLAAQPDVNPAQVGISGISWGGYTSLMLCSLLGERVGAGFCLFGSGCYDLSYPGISSGLAQLSPGDQLEWLRNFDPSVRLQRVRAPMLMYPATRDTFFLPPAVLATYRALPGQKYLCFGAARSHSMELPGGTAHSWPDAEVEPAYFRHMLARQGPLPLVKRTSGLTEELAFAVSPCPPDATPFAYYCTDLTSPWPGREWKRAEVTPTGEGRYRVVLPPEVGTCLWFGGVSFALTAGGVTSPISLSTVLERRER